MIFRPKIYFRNSEPPEKNNNTGPPQLFFLGVLKVRTREHHQRIEHIHWNMSTFIGVVSFFHFFRVFFCVLFSVKMTGPTLKTPSRKMVSSNSSKRF